MFTRWLESMPFAQQSILLLACVGLIWALFYSVIWQPITDQIFGLQINIQTLDEEIQRYSNQRDRIVESPAEEPTVEPVSLSQTVGESLVSIPNGQRNDVYRILGKHQVSLVSWNVGDLNHRGVRGGGVPSVHVQLAGGYHQIAQCLSKILHLPWVLEIIQLQVNSSNTVGNDPSSLLADFRILSM